jgi:F5/8 type C domain
MLLLLAILACQLPQTNPGAPTEITVTQAGTQISTMVPSQTARILTTPTIQATSIRTLLSHRIASHRIYGLAEFYDTLTSGRFIPRGVNYFILVPVLDHYEDRLFGVEVYNHERTQTDFEALSAAGYNTVRIMLDGCTTGTGCIGLEGGKGLNPAYLDNIVDLMKVAKGCNLFLILALKAPPELGGYAQMANLEANQNFAQGPNAQYLTQSGIEAAQAFWSDLLKGLIDRQAPIDIVLGWELRAEQYYSFDQAPFSLLSGKLTTANGHTYNLSNPTQKQILALEGIRYYIDELRKTIIDLDPTGLITMGFFAPDEPNPWREGDGRLVDTAGLLSDSSLDFFDFHAYPGDGLTLAQLAQNFGLIGHISKPILMGEVGAYTWAYPQLSDGAIAAQDWIAASCKWSFTGWLYQGYYPYPAGLDAATWGFVDGQHAIMDELSPVNQPDACATTILPGRNLALGKPVFVSAALPDQTPQMAVDGDPNTQWSAGGFPMQWIEVDLGGPSTIGEIRLTVGQWPAGDTVHQLWAGTTQEEMRLVHEFIGDEFDYDVLDYLPITPLTNIRYVRLVTTESPSWVSWREIEVFAPFPGTPTPTPEQTATATP